MKLEDQKNLGSTGIIVSPIGLGIMQWGRIKLDPSDNRVNQDLMDIFQTTINAGINFIDSAEAYGFGKSETHLGRCLKLSSEQVIVATKFMPYPWRLSRGELRSALIQSLKRLGLARVDLYQVHWPWPPVPIKSWMEAMADVVADGLVRAVGVSNCTPNQTSQAYEILAKHNIPLASNQVRYNLLDRRPERSGLVELCRKLNVTIIAYSPLNKGVLSGKYSPDNLPSGYRSWIYNRGYLNKVQPLIDEIQRIGEAHNGKTRVQVALNWLTCKGAIPIPGARDKKQAEENAGGLGWLLSAEEVAILDRVSDKVTR